MTKEEFMRITAAISTYYPKDDPFQNEEAMQLWYEEFKELPYEAVSIGLRRHVNTSKWCPTIAELKEAIVMITAGNKDWGVAWNECIKAISRYGQYQEEEALASMSPLTRQIVKRLGYRDLCVSENQMQDRANFRMVFDQVAGNEYEKAALPVSLREQITQIGKQQLEGYNGLLNT